MQRLVRGGTVSHLVKQDARFLDFLIYWHARPSEARILIRQAWTGDYLVVTGTLRF
jgi:hypothetical protein